MASLMMVEPSGAAFSMDKAGLAISMAECENSCRAVRPTDCVMCSNLLQHYIRMAITRRPPTKERSNLDGGRA
jgi:hypothetical protein